MTVTQLRRILPGIEIENDPYTIGYWSRWAGLERPAGMRRQEGWDQADADIADDRRFFGSIVVGASERLG